MQQISPNLEAGGTIAPYRFVTINTSNDKQGDQAGANATAVGVANGSTKQFDSANHAEDGDIISLQPGNVVWVEAGGTITRGGRTKSDADGKAVAVATTGTTNQESLGHALESAASGEIIRLYWNPQVIRPALV